MNKITIFIVLLITLSYAKAQSLNKNNKQYEAFLTQYRKEGQIKLIKETFKCPDIVSESNFYNIKEKLFEKEGIIDAYYNETNAVLTLYYNSMLNEDNIMELLKLVGIVNFQKIALQKVNLKE